MEELGEKHTDRGELIWKRMHENPRNHLYMSGMMVTVVVPSFLIFYFFLFPRLDYPVDIILLFATIIGVVILMQRFVMELYFGPRVYSNGIDLQAIGVMRTYGPFIEFGNIKQIKVGLNEETDLEFTERYLKQNKYKKENPKEFIEHVFTEIFLETIDNRIHYLTTAGVIDFELFLSILDENNVAYVINPDLEYSKPE